MRKHLFQSLCFVLMVLLLPSCEFKCNVGASSDKDERGKKGSVVKQIGGAVVYNGIELESHEVKVRKAYLMFANGERVPADNVIDFKQPVKLFIAIDSGWIEYENKVWLGALERVTTDDGNLIMYEKDLFKDKYPDGISPKDARDLALSVSVSLEKNSGPGFVTISFTIWDKKGVGYIRGQYRLYTN